ncbi:GMC oxidoreductase [Xylophilus sp.]|uniref:GMC oxidoreductase n=1 Tax=Xylophilus sp. TaxID=2653893 RepID=UPI0013B70C76|nr:GMC family oxidoreductase [Xylophilus sp.]KAF1045996.1 MAG: 6'''-hydroxyparomomycin C oxidase [Xylophilus sp.]
MIVDAATLPAGTLLEADLCIAGAGAAGIALALALADSGLDVILLEAGGEHESAAAQDFYAGTVADERLHSPTHRYRQRRFGGSTTIWGGRCMPLDPIDFARRDWIPDSGWPIGPRDLAAWYPPANRLCEAGDFAYTIDEAFGEGAPLRRPLVEGFASDAFRTDTLERFSVPTDFARRWRRPLARAERLRVVLGASAAGLGLGGSGRRLETLDVRGPGGRAFAVRARRYVLAAGGLETPRLLLASPGASGRGVGNAHDVVGRYYMCHLAGTIGTIEIAPGHRAWHGYDVADDGVYCRRRFALTAEAQRRLGTVNFIARLHHPRITDPRHRTGILSLLYLAKSVIPYEYGKRLHGDERAGPAGWLAHVRNVVADAPGTARFLAHWVRHRTLAERKFPSVIVHPRSPRYSLDFHAEQVPLRDSRVTLGSGRDAHGMPRLHVDWRYARQDVETVQRALGRLAADLAASGAGRFDYDPQTVEHEMTRYGAYGGHHIGTARMGTDPRTSVVDADCRLHEVDNLYLAGAAVFPTSSQANPTLTIVALALRLADHLRRTPEDVR